MAATGGLKPGEDYLIGGLVDSAFTRLLCGVIACFLLHYTIQFLRKPVKLRVFITSKNTEAIIKRLSRGVNKACNTIEKLITAMEDGIPYKVFMHWTEGSKPELRRFFLFKKDDITGYMKTIKGKVHELYPKLSTKLYTIAWKDEEGDEILMSTDEEVNTMLINNNGSVIKVFVRVYGEKEVDDESENDEVEELATNIGQEPTPDNDGAAFDVEGDIVNCCTCNHPISNLGHRYKCVTCDNYVICMQCEADDKHSEHCVVRMPTTNLTMSVLKASIKKSRKYLKSVASQVYGENKRLRRERSAAKHSRDAKAGQSSKGKDSQQPPAARNWVEIFSSYMEQFTNVAVDQTRKPEDEGAQSEAGPSTGTDTTNPWHLPKEDVEQMQRACKYLRENSVNTSVQVFNKALDMAASVAEEITAAASAIPPYVSEISESPKQQTPSASAPTPRQVVLPPKESDELTAEQSAHADKVFEERIRAYVNERQAAMAAAAQKLPKTKPKQNEEPDAEATCDVSSNASSSASEKGWTVLDQSKAESAAVNDFPADLFAMYNFGDEDEEEEEEMEQRYASLYPALNTATAAMDINDASAPPLPAHGRNYRLACARHAQARAAQAKAIQAKIAQAKAAHAKSAQAKPAQAKSAQAKPNQTMPTQTKQVQPEATRFAAAVQQMEDMGFSNESGWLTHLLASNGGNIATVIDLIAPVKPK